MGYMSHEAHRNKQCFVLVKFFVKIAISTSIDCHTTNRHPTNRHRARMRQYASFAIIFALISACSATSTITSSPSINALYICQGMNVSNAPPVDQTGRVRDFYNTHNIRGKHLYTLPTKGCLSSGFGKRHGGAGNLHKGIDIFTKKPSDIVASASGKISFIGSQSGYGRLIELDHGNGVKTKYAHLSEFARGLKFGSTLKQGSYLGKTGKSGNATAVHLHYEILVNERQRNPLGF